MLSEAPLEDTGSAMAKHDAIFLCRRTTLLRYFQSCISQNGVSDLLALRLLGNCLPCFSELIRTSLEGRNRYPMESRKKGLRYDGGVWFRAGSSTLWAWQWHSGPYKELRSWPSSHDFW
jgi:hypothetical protein